MFNQMQALGLKPLSQVLLFRAVLSFVRVPCGCSLSYCLTLLQPIDFSLDRVLIATVAKVKSHLLRIINARPLLLAFRLSLPFVPRDYGLSVLVALRNPGDFDVWVVSVSNAELF